MLYCEKEAIMHYIQGLLAFVAGLALLAWPMPSSAQSRERCFPETGFCISGPIRTYWEQHGGLAVFGYPTTALTTTTVEDWTGPAQFFERDRLEDHGAQGIMAGRLGARLLELQGRPWQQFPTVDTAPSGCRYFVETRQSLCEPFLSYWQRQGGLERFGFPITGVLEEPVGEWRGAVQYFERRRMEHHRELSNTPYEVLLGLLGTEVRYLENPQACGDAVIPELQNVFAQIPADYKAGMGCPTGVLRDTPATYQLFGQGQAISLDQPGATQRIYVVFRYDWLHSAPQYTEYPYTWRAGEPEVQVPSATPDCYPLMRGIGKLWREQSEVSSALGCATAAERAQPAIVQTFSTGALVWLTGQDTVFVFGPHRAVYETSR
jgi:hypothetical protein